MPTRSRSSRDGLAEPGRRRSRSRSFIGERRKRDRRAIRVLQVIDGLEVGGAQAVLLVLLALGRERGLELYVANVGRRYDRALVDEIRDVAHRMVLPNGRALWDLRSLAALVWTIIRHDIDVVHTHLAGAEVVGGWAAWLTRRPAVATLHSVYEGRAGLRPARRRLADFATLRLAHRLIAVSHAVKASYVEGLALSSDRLTVLTNVVRGPLVPPGFDPARKRAALGVADRLVACTVSRLTENRDHATLLRALPAVRERCPALVVLVVGDGPLRDDLAQLSRALSLDDTVRFLGTRYDAIEIMAASDVFLQPTLLEGLPMGVLEAMTVGVPVAASRVPGLEELIDHDLSGLLVAPRDVAGWERTLLRLLGSSALRLEMGEQGRRTAAARFDSDAWMLAIERIYRELVRRG